MSGDTFSKWSLPPHVITPLFDVIRRMVSPILMEKDNILTCFQGAQRSHGLGPKNQILWNAS